MRLANTIEAILFVASAPVTVAKLARELHSAKTEVEDALAELETIYGGDSGIVLARSGDTAQLVSNARYFQDVEAFTKSEVLGELTRAQLETLTIVAYRGPVTRSELESIRGVNCAVILRNLEMRGLVEEKEIQDELLPVYELSVDALRFLGIASASKLPDYETLHANIDVHEHTGG